MTAQVRSLIAEFLGAYALVFIGCLAVISAGTDLGVPVGLVVIALGFGLGLLVALFAFGEVSGGHFNPAVSLAALLDGRIDPATFVQYIVAQVAGAVAGALTLLVAFDQASVASAATIPSVGVGSAFLLETVLTALFVAVILKVTSSSTNSVNSFVAIALTLAVIHLVLVPFTGTSVNPARTLGPAIVGNIYTDLWIYMTAPFVGGAIGWGLFQVVSGPAAAPDQAN